MIFDSSSRWGCHETSARFLAVWLILLGLGAGSALVAQEEGKSRDRFKPDLAGNEEVERVIRNFQGKGAIGDDSDPTPAEEAVKRFEVAEGLTIDLVSAEPTVMQPLYISFDARGRMWVVQYLQYPFPAGLKVIRYDQYLRAVFDDVPRPPPDHVPGKDKVTVFEDTDGDGNYDTHKDVIDDLNIASAVVTGRGGIWVLNPPYLLFYPDADGDDVPDGAPEVKLTGFGLQDTHSVANSLRWGPDGWLYGANGSTTTASVTSKASRQVAFEGQCIWRFHPESEVFEVYAEGGGNTFSLEIDGRGRVFSGTNHGDTRGMFYPQGSYGEKNWGKHGPLTNPYAFGYFKHMEHEGDKDRFPQTFVIYEGGTLPERYHHNVIAANALHNRVWASELMRQGSTFHTVDLPVVCRSDDQWFRPVDVKVGPDGAVYLADWYDTRLSHVDPRDNWHKSSGRIYRLQADNAAAQKPVNLLTLSDEQLIERFAHANKWHRQTAVRVLGERLRSSASEEERKETVARLKSLATSDDPRCLEALWSVHLAGVFDDALAGKLLTHADPDIRRWAVRLLGDRRQVTSLLAKSLADLARQEPEVQVRSQLASTAKRLETAYALPVLQELIRREEDLYDPHLPLLIWWAFEAHCGTEVLQSSPQVGVSLDPENEVSPRKQILEFFSDTAVWNQRIVREVVLSRLMKRFAMEEPAPKGSDSSLGPLEVCTRLLELAPTDEHRGVLMAGFLEAYQGREIAKLPTELRTAIEEYQLSLGESDIVLGLRLGQADAVKKALALIRDESAEAPTRLAVINTLGEVEVPQAVSSLLALLRSPSSGIQKAALQALMRYPDPQIGKAITSAYQSSLTDTHGQREAAQRVLASRPEWTAQFLTEIEEHRIRASTVSPEILQQMRLHQDPAIQERLDRLWGKTRATAEEKLTQIAELRSLLTRGLAPGAERTPDHEAGRALFKQHCGTCHTLFSEGGNTGPNLTGYERSNLAFLLLAIVDPSAAIREEFTQFQVVTTDGRVLTGLITEQTPNTVTLRGANNQATVLPRDEIEILQAMTTSIMPEGVMQKLTEEQILDLFAYLMRPTPAAGG